MRVISGRFGGRRLKAVPSRLTRPTTDKVKESLFNVIGPYFQGGAFLDLYAGSGSVAIEAVSRGITKAVLVDHQYRAYRTIINNVKSLRADKAFKVIKSSARSALSILAKRTARFNYVYLDPPYKLSRMKHDLLTLARLNLLAPNALVICETDDQSRLEDDVDHYRLVEQKHYGMTILTIYQFMGA